MAVLTPEIHSSPVGSMLLALSTSELVQFTVGISASGERFIAAMTRAGDGHTSRVSVLLLRTSPKRTTLSLITHVDVERRIHIYG